MKKPEYIQLLIQVSDLYYNKNLTQQEISAKLNTTRQSVSKLLNEAKTEGIVEIKINNPLSDMQILSNSIKEIFKIQNALVIPGNFDDEEINREIISKRAIEYVNELINLGYKKIGLSWGRTVYTFIKSYQFSNNISKIGSLNTDKAINNNNIIIEALDNDIRVFPLVGASNEVAPYYMINEMVRRFAEQISGKPIFIYIPVNPGNADEYELFTRTQTFMDISNVWKDIDLAIVGIGALPPSRFLNREEYPGEKEIYTKINPKIVVGDICTKYFDINGNIISPKESQNLISISEASLRKAKRVLALASGLEKIPAIKGALNSGLISDIILDEKTAKELVVS